MPITTQSAKGKGRRLQQAVVRDILAAFPHCLAADDVRSTSMGAGGEDVQLSPAARQCMPYSIECKNTERLALWDALQQCEANAPPGATPLVVFKRNHSRVYAVVPWEHFLSLCVPPRAADEDEGGAAAGEPDAAHAAKRRRVVAATAILQDAVKQATNILHGEEQDDAAQDDGRPSPREH